MNTIRINVADLTFDVPATEENFRRFAAQSRRLQRELEYIGKAQGLGEWGSGDDADEFMMLYETFYNSLLGAQAFAQISSRFDNHQQLVDAAFPVVNTFITEFHNMIA